MANRLFNTQARRRGFDDHLRLWRGAAAGCAGRDLRGGPQHVPGLGRSDHRTIRRVWTAIARGELTTSFDAAKELKLPLGGTLPMTVARTHQLRLGAFDTVGLPDADAVVSREKAKALGLPANAGMLISAPKANLRSLTESLPKAFGGAVSVRPLRALPPVPAAAANPPAAPVQQPAPAGPHVSYADARPGDVLAWAGDPTPPGYVTHVALYLGNGMMISAAHTGTLISVTPVYFDGLLGAVRFL